MSIFMVSVFLAIILWCYFRVKYNEIVSLEYKFKFFALRDKLRYAVVEGKISSDNWIIDYLDSSMSRIVNALPSINLYSTILLVAAHKNDAAVHKLENDIQKTISLYPEVKEIYNQYGQLLVAYFIKRHLAVLLITSLPIYSFVLTFRAVNKLKDAIKGKILDLRILPETSDYLMQPMLIKNK